MVRALQLVKLVCGAGARGRRQQLDSRQGEAGGVVRELGLHVMQDEDRQQRLYLGESGLRGSGGGEAAAGRQAELVGDLGSGDSWAQVRPEDYLVRGSGLLLGGQQGLAAEEAAGPGQQVSTGPVQLHSKKAGDRDDYLAGLGVLPRQGGEEDQQQHGLVGR